MSNDDVYDYCYHIEKEVKEDGKVQVKIEELFKFINLDFNNFNDFDIYIWSIIEGFEKDEKIDITSEIYAYLKDVGYITVSYTETDLD